MDVLWDEVMVLFFYCFFLSLYYMDHLLFICIIHSICQVMTNLKLQLKASKSKTFIHSNAALVL